MTNPTFDQAQKAQQAAEQANQEIAQANQKIDDLKENLQRSTVTGDPDKATTGQLITGDY